MRCVLAGVSVGPIVILSPGLGEKKEIWDKRRGRFFSALVFGMLGSVLYSFQGSIPNDPTFQFYRCVPYAQAPCQAKPESPAKRKQN